MYRVAALDDGHDLTTFRSGNPSLDAWLRDQSRQATAQGTRTYLMVDEGDIVSGYFAVAPHLIEREDLPRRVGRGAPRQIPAILLAKLALSESLHGQGFGAELLVRALQKIVEIARAVGGKVIVVDAIDDVAVGFYRHHHFEPLPVRTDRLIMKMSTAARAIGENWP